MMGCVPSATGSMTNHKDGLEKTLLLIFEGVSNHSLPDQFAHCIGTTAPNVFAAPAAAAAAMVVQAAIIRVSSGEEC